MKITYLGHACFIVETNGTKILFDPFITDNELVKDIKAEDVEADIILITHGHSDHLADAEIIAKKNDCTIVSNFEIVNWFAEKNIQGHPMNHGGKWNFNFGIVKYVNAVHTSSLPDGKNGGAPGGFVVWNDEGCFYHAGDTALSMDMKLIPQTCPPLDFAILPIGDNFTMGYKDAAIAAEFIECNTIIGCHYDTFGFIKINHSAAKNAFSAKGKELVLLDIGSSWTK